MTKKRISQSKGERCRVFSCPQHKQQPAPQEAAQGLLGALAPEDLKSIQKHGVEGYDVVAVVDAHTRQATVVSNISGRLSLADITDNLTAYSRPLKQALEGHIQHYEWGLEKAGKHCFYQTTLIPLSGENNQLERIIFLKSDITYWGGV